VNDQGLSDYQLIPDKGSVNPYATRANHSHPDTYTVYITPKGDHGYPVSAFNSSQLRKQVSHLFLAVFYEALPSCVLCVLTR
jgi:hypothetical protein